VTMLEQSRYNCATICLSEPPPGPVVLLLLPNSRDFFKPASAL